jgi:hypothetical protein
MMEGSDSQMPDLKAVIQLRLDSRILEFSKILPGLGE